MDSDANQSFFSFGMRQTLLSALVFVVITASAISAEGRSIQDSPVLIRLMELLENAATEHPSLVRFDYDENFLTHEDLSECERVTGRDVSTYLTELMETLLGPTANRDHRQALRDFRTIVGTGKYWKCQDQGPSSLSFQQSVQFISVSGRYKVQFSLGFED